MTVDAGGVLYWWCFLLAECVAVVAGEVTVDAGGVLYWWCFLLAECVAVVGL